MGPGPTRHGALDPDVSSRGNVPIQLEELPGLGNAQHRDVPHTGLARRGFHLTLQLQGERPQRVAGALDRLVDLTEVDLRGGQERVAQVLLEGVDLYSVGANLAP